MADTILFEELGEAPELEVSVAAAIALSVKAYVDAPTSGAFAYGEIPLTFEAPAYDLEPPAILVAYGEIPVASGYSFIPAVVPVTVDAVIAISCFATTEPLFVRGVIPITCEATSLAVIPVDDSPFVEIDDWTFLADATAYEEFVGAASRLRGGDLSTAMANRMAVQGDNLSLRDRLRILLEAVVVDSATFASAMTGDPVVTAALVDALLLSGAVEGSVSAMALLSDAMALQEALASVQEGDITDAAALADTIESLARALEVVVSSAVFSEALAGLAVLTIAVPDALAIADDANGQAVYTALLSERLDFTVSFALDGVPYVGRAMNTANRAVTEYTQFDYNSLASFNGKLYGAGAAGLYRLEGSTDAGAPIAAYLRTAMQRLEGGKEVRMADAYIGVRANGELQLKVTVTKPGATLADPSIKIGYVYDLQAAPRGAPQPGRFKIGRGIKTVYGAFTLSNVAGADFAVDVLEIHPLVLDRRLP